MTVMSKSPNKHNRIYLTAAPLDEELVKAIDDGEVTAEQESKMRAKNMSDNFGWDNEEARRIWSFGLPPDGIANILVELTKGVQFMSEIKDSVSAAFQQASLCGVYCEEAVRGLRANVNDVVMHADAIHRGAGQMMPTMKRALYAVQMVSEPALMEPMYLCDITVPANAVSGVYTTLNARRGQVEAKIDRVGTPLSQIKAYLPVLESFGLTQLLRQNTSGQAFPQMIFSHWEVVKSDLTEAGSQAYGMVMKVRERKGLKVELPNFNDYYDRL
jgi:elongation factor 2